VSFPSVLDDVTREAASRLAEDRAVLYLYDEPANSFARAASIGLPADLESEQVGPDLQDTLLGAFSRDEPFVVSSWDDAPLESERGVLLLPLVADFPVGVFVVSWSGSDVGEAPAGVARDAAQRIAAAIARGQEERHFQLVLEAEQTGVAVVEGPRHILSHVSASMRNFLGLQAVPALARSFGAVFPSEVRDPLVSSLDVVRETGEPTSRLGAAWANGHGDRYFEYRVLPGAHPDTRIIAVWPGNDTEVAGEALAASIRALRDSQSMLGAVLDNTNNGIFLIDPDLRVLYANKRMGEMFGIDVVNTIGRNKREVIKAEIMQQMEDPPGFTARLTYLYEHMDQVAIDEVVVARPSRRILDRYSAPVHKEDGTLLGRIEVYSDVTEIRELQRSKDEFLSLVSHELRTPVTSIKGYAQLLRRRAAQQPVAARTAIAYEAIERQTLRMQSLIDTLLDLSRLEAGRLQLHFVPVDFVALSRHVADMVKMTTEDHEIMLQVPLDPLWVRGDEHRLEQIMTNLLSNAVRYSSAGTRVVVELGRENGMIRASVSDEGVGILPEALDHVFERFFRAEGVRESTGLGIGLYITKRFVEEHGGAIDVRSEVGSGSTFTVWLPRLETSSSGQVK
jgi:PAS domain S-box-containing protein